ncbi:Trehalose import ATP-binding protein SugC [Baekduia alba]|uniref:ABC transporter ATP-binding protein n=1 Tax=Baekduia alba TaxID=2997333 RepID=UPI0023400361|nr:sn-glycerol-3-phosphate ABC transporter ATP-binding protein UgpC [Baekduia alba]WCB91825.1 Trehalose import ATP-binding protein SugC [Baekduia alba]
MAAIEFDGITKRYPDGHEAVKALDLTIDAGEFVILVGPSGCGKSTALRMVAGLEEISAGDLRIDGERVNDREPRDRDIAMVFQSYALYPHMTVRDNMGFALRLAGTPKEEIARRVDDASAALDLGAHLDRKPAQLSGGQRQRVAMGRAIVREPRAFLMDEPLSNLDAKLRVQMRTEVARLQRRLETTTLYVTHDQTEAMTLGDRVAVLRGGVLQQFDTPQRLYRQPANAFVGGFIGSPAMNMIAGELAEDTILTPLGPIPLEGLLDRDALAAAGGRTVTVGIRPEHFEDGRRVDPARRGLAVLPRVELTESVGSDLYVHFPVSGQDAGAALAIARLAPDVPARAGERVNLFVDPARVHVFDADSGVALRTAAVDDPVRPPAPALV